MPPMTAEGIGYGAGTAERSIANLLRLFIGSSDSGAIGYEVELVNGRRVRVGGEFDEGTLSRLVRTLEG